MGRTAAIVAGEQAVPELAMAIWLVGGVVAGTVHAAGVAQGLPAGQASSLIIQNNTEVLELNIMVVMKIAFTSGGVERSMLIEQ